MNPIRRRGAIGFYLACAVIVFGDENNNPCIRSGSTTTCLENGSLSGGKAEAGSPVYCLGETVTFKVTTDAVDSGGRKKNHHSL